MASDQKAAWQHGIATRTGRIALVGYAALALFVGGLGTWAFTAPLSGATVAPGIIAAAGQNIMVQHLEGGIVKEVVHREGDAVAAGERLLVLDSTAARAQLERLQQQLLARRVEIARLRAERDGASVLSRPDTSGFPESMAPEQVFAEEQREFSTRLSRYNSEKMSTAEQFQATVAE